MRIEISSDMAKELDKIKHENWRIAGKGHSDTIRFLIDQFKQHGTIEQILAEELSQIPKIVQTGFHEAFRTFINNLMKEPQSNQ